MTGRLHRSLLFFLSLHPPISALQGSKIPSSQSSIHPVASAPSTADSGPLCYSSKFRALLMSSLSCLPKDSRSTCCTVILVHPQPRVLLPHPPSPPELLVPVSSITISQGGPGFFFIQTPPTTSSPPVLPYKNLLLISTARTLFYSPSPVTWVVVTALTGSPAATRAPQSHSIQGPGDETMSCPGLSL